MSPSWHSTSENEPCGVVSDAILRCDSAQYDVSTKNSYTRLYLLTQIGDIGNGGDIPIGSRCTNCVAFEYECTYTTPTTVSPSISHVI